MPNKTNPFKKLMELIDDKKATNDQANKIMKYLYDKGLLTWKYYHNLKPGSMKDTYRYNDAHVYTADQRDLEMRKLARTLHPIFQKIVQTRPDIATEISDNADIVNFYEYHKQLPNIFFPLLKNKYHKLD